MEKRLLSASEAANALGISRSVLYVLMAQGAIGSIKVGRSRRIPAGAVDEFVADRVREERERTAGG